MAIGICPKHPDNMVRDIKTVKQGSKQGPDKCMICGTPYIILDSEQRIAHRKARRIKHKEKCGYLAGNTYEAHPRDIWGRTNTRNHG